MITFSNFLWLFRFFSLFLHCLVCLIKHWLSYSNSMKIWVWSQGTTPYFMMLLREPPPHVLETTTACPTHVLGLNGGSGSNKLLLSISDVQLCFFLMNLYKFCRILQINYYWLKEGESSQTICILDSFSVWGMMYSGFISLNAWFWRYCVSEMNIKE